MNQKETKISRIYENKSGELVLSFRFAFGELTVEEKENLKTLWRDDVSLSLQIERFQEFNLES